MAINLTPVTFHYNRDDGFIYDSAGRTVDEFSERYYPQDEADRVISELAQQTRKWNKISEVGLPENNGPVYTWDGTAVLSLEFRDGMFVCFPYISDVYLGITHWMPRLPPQPPAEGV